MVPCVYCLSTATLRDEQILLRGRSVYLCAPRGQLVEGFLAVAPYACASALSRLPVEWLAELERMTALVEAFYAEAYGRSSWLFYEQGRGGAGAPHDPRGQFPFHAHLCALPLDVDLHAALATQLEPIAITRLEDLTSAVCNGTYVYVARRDSGGGRHRAVYMPQTPAMRAELEQSRLKPLIAALAGLPGRGYCRTCAGDRELASLIARFARWRTSASIGDDDACGRRSSSTIGG